MDRNCKPFEADLADLAEGKPAPEAERHVAGCADCARRLEELRRVVSAARQKSFEAPADLIARAQALMAPQVRRIVARLLGNSLQTVGARTTRTDEFSLHLGAENLSVRLLYRQTKDGWEVEGRAPAQTWTVVQTTEETACGPSGRFRIAVPSLEAAAFVLRGPDVEVVIPTASEVIGREP